MQVKRKFFLPLCMLYMGNSLHLILSIIFTSLANQANLSNSMVHSFTLHMDSCPFLAMNYIVEDRIIPLF